MRDRYSELFANDPEFKDHRTVLQDQYITLMRVTLPAIARQQKWTLQEDHCFMRVVLDQLFQDCWYNHLDKRLRAYKQLNNEQLKRAIAMGNAIQERGNGLLEKWNRESLAWRSRT